MRTRAEQQHLCWVCLGAFAICLLGGTRAWPAILTVRADGSGDYPTIQEAIDAAQNGDEVVLEPGTYTGEGNRNIDFKGKAITVRNTNPNDTSVVAATILDLGFQGHYDGFRFEHAEGPDSIVAGVTLNVTIASGAAMRCLAGSTPTITDCTITGPEGVNGQGIICDHSSPTIRRCTITRCNASNGAAIACYFSNPIVADCVISENRAAEGAGICCAFGSSPTIEGCTIDRNWSSSHGAGIACFSGSTPRITNCQITRNAIEGDGAGGGIYIANSNPTISGCVIRDNHGSNWEGGGGIYIVESATEVRLCDVSMNSSSFNGGGIMCKRASLRVVNCYIVANHARLSGGAVFSSESNLLMQNCTAVGNGALYSAGISCGGGSLTMNSCILWSNHCSGDVLEEQVSISTSTAHIQYSCIQGGPWSGAGNLSADPLFAQSGYWTGDRWEGGTYRLQSRGGRWDTSAGSGAWVLDSLTSPCIDAGDPGLDFSNEPVPNGGRINMGADGNTPYASQTGALLTGLTIAGPEVVDENSRANYFCEAAFTDGAVEDVTARAEWSEDSEWIDVKPGGLLSASPVPANQVCRVTASYAGQTAEFTVTVGDTDAPTSDGSSAPPGSGPPGGTQSYQDLKLTPAVIDFGALAPGERREPVMIVIELADAAFMFVIDERALPPWLEVDPLFGSSANGRATISVAVVSDDLESGREYFAELVVRIDDQVTRVIPLRVGIVRSPGSGLCPGTAAGLVAMTFIGLLRTRRARLSWGGDRVFKATWPRPGAPHVPLWRTTGCAVC